MRQKTENEKQPEFFDTFPHEVILEVLRHLNNIQLAGVGRVNLNEFYRLVNVVQNERNFTTNNAILPNQTYYVLGNTVQMTKTDLLGFYYTKAREVPNKEIKEAAPKPQQMVSVFRTKEEAERVAASRVDHDPLSPAMKQVVFAVKLKDGQAALQVEFQQDPKSKTESTNLSFDHFKTIAGYHPRSDKEIIIARKSSQDSTWGFFQKAKQEITDAMSSLGHGNEHRPNQPK